ncbi:MAG TPA: hypothetical protein DGG95_11040 [Cytophagales bacterium]|nr:hypothetical protein [Cytophagales bacterium]
MVHISDQSYFPLRVGNYQIYTVNETDINRLSCSTSLVPKKYDLKVLVFDSVKNTEGGFTYLIHRYTRADSTQAWIILDSWSARKDVNQVVVNEGNTPYVKLVFPMASGTLWNGNTYNGNAVEDYTMTDVGKSYTQGNGKKFSSTVTVVQSDNQDFIVYQDKRIEVYAASVGLIYKETTQLTYFQNDCGSGNTCCLGTQDPKTGIIYTQELKSYGRE